VNLADIHMARQRPGGQGLRLQPQESGAGGPESTTKKGLQLIVAIVTLDVGGIARCCDDGRRRTPSL
jgi:hypothetical protein